MPARNQNLHGNVPDSYAVALLLIDVINDLEFTERALRADTRPAAKLDLRKLRARTRASAKRPRTRR